MVGIALFVLQAISGPPAPGPVRAAPAARPCPVSQTDEVVVCAKPNDQYRLAPIPGEYVPPTALPRAELRVFGDSKVSFEGEQGADAQGGPVNRAMVRLKIPLGGKRK